jgi:CRISPR system Cascade subunit CasE
MHLSRIDLRPEAVGRADVRKRLASMYGVHQLLWELFSDGPDRRRDFLFREEPRDRLDPAESVFRAYTLSSRPPLAGSTLFRVQTKTIEPALVPGDRLRFSVRVNPVVSRSSGDRSKPNARHDVVYDELRRRKASGADGVDPAEVVQGATLAWLQRQGGRHGFTFDDKHVAVDGYRQHRFRKRGGHEVRLSTVDLEGVLTVTEPRDFLARWERGLGPAKGFGCGLMMIRRA